MRGVVIFLIPMPLQLTESNSQRNCHRLGNFTHPGSSYIRKYMRQILGSSRNLSPILREFNLSHFDRAVCGGAR
ncbi:hypothetical protein V1519DRAFT_441970 [Lipomyces tetrasporus]